MSGQKIIDALREAQAGDLARVTIEGETWARVKDIHSDQQEIMRINNALRDALIQIRTVCDDNASDTCNKAMALAFVREVAAATIK